MKYFLLFVTEMLISSCIPTISAFTIIKKNEEIIYSYMGSVRVGAQAPIDEDSTSIPPTTEWTVRGTFKLQMLENSTIAAALTIEKIILNNTGDVFYQNKEMQNIYLPFKIVLNENNVIEYIEFKEKDSIWSKNIKRAIASAIQIQGEKSGAFILLEPGIHGICTTEYYITRINSTNISIRKTPELNSCKPYPGGLHLSRSNVPTNPCDFDHQKNVIVGTEGLYEIIENDNNEFYMQSAHIEGTAMVHTFESNGEAQYVYSQLLLNRIDNTQIVNVIDIVSDMALTGVHILSPLEFEESLYELTGGRQPIAPETLIRNAQTLLLSLTDTFEDSNLNFDKPFDNRIVELIKIMSSMDFESLCVLYRLIDIGTSYRQETVRNIFYELLPRIGSKASALLTRDLIVTNSIRPTMAVQLLMALPFHIDELSQELITECESLLLLDQGRPDVTQAAALSYATLISRTYAAERMTKTSFEKYIKRYFDLYLYALDYEQKMLYLLALGNLQLANVYDYLEPIIRDSTQNRDIRFLAAWSVMGGPYPKMEKVYETYWPIFEDRNTTLELRIIAFTMLLITNPSPARLMSLHRIMTQETNPHLINYYRTTVMSVSGTTYPCYEHLRRLVSYMSRHIPESPGLRYWVSGNYIFDYRDKNYGVGAMLQSQFIGEENTDLPYILAFKLDTEALGRFSGQMGMLIKVRGLNNAMISRAIQLNKNYLKVNKLAAMLTSLNVPTVSLTPFHMELILQIEGKSVLSFFLNETTYRNLTDGEIINRMYKVLLSNSHINMQIIRSPFMIKYSTPTVLGTPAEIIIQSTVLSSLRGNITQNSSLARNYQIDSRYSSYSVCKSESYNPFLNMHHTIHREQGFLLYMPIHNQLTLDFVEPSLHFAFYRTANLTSGLSFKSRSLTTTKGHILRSDVSLYNEILNPKSDDLIIKLNDYKIPSLGIKVKFSFNLQNIGDLIATIFTDSIVNTKSLPDLELFLNNFFMIWEAIQLNSIYIGNNREFSMLFTNEQDSKMHGVISSKETIHPRTDKMVSDREVTITFNLSLEHQMDDDVIQTWEHVIKITNYYNSSKLKITALTKGQTVDKTDFRMCFEGIYIPFVFLKQTEQFNATILFGTNSDAIFCPIDRATLNITMTRGMTDDMKEAYDDHNNKHINENSCPREILKLNPPPIIPSCKDIKFNKYTSITNNDIDLKYSNMPELFYTCVNRLQHLVSVFTDAELNFTDGIHLGIHTPNDELAMIVTIENETFHIPNFLISQVEDSKFDSEEKLRIDYGLDRSCSIIKSKLSTFSDELIDLKLHQKDIFKKDCGTLLVADCSAASSFALFLENHIDIDTYGLKIFTEENYITYEPIGKIMSFNGLENVTLTSQTSQLLSSLNDKKYDFSAYINDEDILVIETDAFHVKIQYDMKDIMSIQVYSFYMERICGLCSSINSNKYNNNNNNKSTEEQSTYSDRIFHLCI